MRRQIGKTYSLLIRASRHGIFPRISHRITPSVLMPVKLSQQNELSMGSLKLLTPYRLETLVYTLQIYANRFNPIKNQRPSTSF